VRACGRQAHLLEDRHLGVILSVMSLLIALASKAHSEYELCVPYVIALLSRLVITSRACGEDYLYYNTPSPWLQVRLQERRPLRMGPGPSSTSDRVSSASDRMEGRPAFARLDARGE
jgi:hypothetical protein